MKITGQDLHDLLSLANQVCPSDVAFATCRTDCDPSTLFSTELEVIKPAVPSRQAEFAAGRLAARAALAQLGQAPVAIVAGSGREPLWPEGFVGSISHCRTVAIAAAAKSNSQLGFIGIDIEETEPLDSDLWDSICSSNERELFQLGTGAGRQAKIIFSIKEAVYKAQYPATGRLLDFRDVDILSIDADGHFVACVSSQNFTAINGHFAVSHEFIIAFAAAGLR